MALMMMMITMRMMLNSEHITRCSLHSICVSMLRNPFCKDTSHCVCALCCAFERIVLQGSESRTNAGVSPAGAQFPGIHGREDEGIPWRQLRRSKDAQRITIRGGRRCCSVCCDDVIRL